MVLYIWKSYRQGKALPNLTQELKRKVSAPATNQLQKQKKQSFNISSPKLVSFTAQTNDQHETRQKTPSSEKKNLVMYCNVQEDKPEIRSVTPENVQQCLEGMGFDFSKYSQFNAHQQRQRHLNTLNEIE